LFSTTRFRELTTAVKKEDYVVVAVSAKNVSHLFDELSRKKTDFPQNFRETQNRDPQLRGDPFAVLRTSFFLDFEFDG
jgi:hypothetical protein